MMKKVLIVLLISLSSLALYGQKVEIGGFVPVNLAYQDWREDFSNMCWLYIWDVSAATFEKEFCLIEKKNVESGRTEYDAIYAHNVADNPVLSFVNRTRNPFMILGTDDHEPMYYKGTSGFSLVFVEFKEGNRYCNSYSISYSPTDHLVKNKTGNCFYYAEYDESGRMMYFSDDGFTSNEIIDSNRQISPEDPWEVRYNTNGDVCRVVNHNIDITLQWAYKDNYIQFQKVDETKNKDVPDYDRHRIRYSDLDDKGRWTKETIYDYDVIKDMMVPVCVIKRTFLPADQFDLYKKCGFNPDMVANLPKETETPKNDSAPEENVILIPQVKPSFNGGDASEFYKWLAKNMKYPAIAEENGIEGKVVVQFVVDTNGNVTDVKVVRGAHPVLDKEAVRVVSSSPQWTPASTNGEPVSVTLTVPLIFSLR